MTHNETIENKKVKTNMKYQLASRWSRFLASMIDGILIAFVTIPVVYFTDGFEYINDELVVQSYFYNTLIGLLGILTFIIINYKFLIEDGQTIGKKIVEIKIVNLDNNLPEKRMLLNRYLVYFIPDNIVIIGVWLSTINILFIFGKEKRCIHDYIAKTKVINKKEIYQELYKPTINESDNNFKLSFPMHDYKVWDDLKIELMEFYNKYELNNLVSDKENSWMINTKNNNNFMYVALSIKNDIIYLDVFKAIKPNTKIINKIIEQINSYNV